MSLCSCKPKSISSLSALLLAALSVSVAHATANNPPSFDPGPGPVSSHCDGLVRFSDWALNVTDGDDGTSPMKFHMVEVSNNGIFSQPPHVSWPSYTLSYQLKPGTPGGMAATITAVLKDSSGTNDGGSDTSEPRTWKIHTRSCSDDESVLADSDSDGIPDIDEGNGVLDTDGDGLPDSQDTDSDNDGIADADENVDSDNDGILDSVEPLGIDVSTDSDDDGIVDEFDIDDDNDGITDELEGMGFIDTDGDNVPDSLDLDSDNDGQSDLFESGIILADIQYTMDGVILGETGENGFVNDLETIDGELPVLNFTDSNNNGIPDFQDSLALILADGSVQSNGMVITGLDGIGCMFCTNPKRDPFLLIATLLGLTGLLVRRRYSQFTE